MTKFWVNQQMEFSEHYNPYFFGYIVFEPHYIYETHYIYLEAKRKDYQYKNLKELFASNQDTLI